VNSTVRQIIFWVLIIGGAFLLYQVFNGKTTTKDAKINYPQLLQKAQDKQIRNATIEEGRGVRGELTDGQTFNIDLTNEFIQAELAKKFNENGVDFSFKS